jgi:hypothetical protein
MTTRIPIFREILEFILRDNINYYNSSFGSIYQYIRRVAN